MSTPVSEKVHRPLRADARRNRERVLAAARATFVQLGADVPMEEVARRAGVGVGTIYRHFPTKQVLIDELTRQWIADGAANAALALAYADPWQALVDYIHRGAEVMARDRGLSETFGNIHKSPTDDSWAVDHPEYHANVCKLLDRARDAGVLRPDVGFPEFQAVMCGLFMAVGHGAEGAHALYADILLQGLRPVS